MSSLKCKNCGGSEIDHDQARGDSVCMGCGSVLEHSIIVSSIQFEDNAHGGSSAIGQFVSSDSKGGARGFGGSFHTGLGVESREITLRNAKKKITDLAHQMRLNQHCIETAFNFFKMALSRHLTRGRKTGNVVAACVYMTCRIEGTAHMLIDFCDALDSVGVYELGRTYLRLSQALCINIPALDPCLYILRFANRLEFGEKTHQVSMTALRLVQRMKRDSMHTGRRPSGLCGAALLMAARLHEFNRSVSDIIKIVKVHESTLRKRLLEFGETPSSSLSLDEFMTVDLEEEQDPPSFKAARKKDHQDRLQKIIEAEDISQNITALQLEIEKELEDVTSKKRVLGSKITGKIVNSETETESRELNNFVEKSTIEAIEECLRNPGLEKNTKTADSTGIPPSFKTLGLTSEPVQITADPSPVVAGDGELITDDLDDDELDQYILTDKESKFKDTLWMKINESYLQEQKEREEKLAKEKEEGKPEKKRKKYATKKSKNTPAANTANEAIEKMLQEKKMSSKINYDVLKSLTLLNPEKETTGAEREGPMYSRIRLGSVSEPQNPTEKSKMSENKNPIIKEEAFERKMIVDEKDNELDDTEAEDDMDDGEPEPPPEKTEMSLSELLQHHHTNEDEDADEYYGEDYDEDY